MIGAFLEHVLARAVYVELEMQKREVLAGFTDMERRNRVSLLEMKAWETYCRTECVWLIAWFGAEMRALAPTMIAVCPRCRKLVFICPADIGREHGCPGKTIDRRRDEAYEALLAMQHGQQERLRCFEPSERT